VYIQDTVLFQGPFVNTDVWSTGLHMVRLYTSNGIS